MTEIGANHEGVGQIQIADDVIAAIAGTAALEAEGIVALAGNFTGDLAEKFGKKSISKGIKVSIESGLTSVDVSIIVKFGHKVQDVSANVQSKVKNAIETMTGLSVESVNVLVAGLTQDK